MTPAGDIADRAVSAPGQDVAQPPAQPPTRPRGQAQQDDLLALLIRLGDDHLILGHRLSEWCGHAPMLEEDLALPNMALDLQIGRASCRERV